MILKAYANLLDQKWEESVDGRKVDVPKPEIMMEKQVSKVRLRGDSQSLVTVVDNGTQDHEPKGLGYGSEGYTTRMAVRVRTSHSRERAEGFMVDPDGNVIDLDDGEIHEEASPERYGGLVGECRRILKTTRRGGFAGFDVTTIQSTADDSGNYGKNHWRYDIAFTGRVVASTINTDVELDG